MGRQKLYKWGMFFFITYTSTRIKSEDKHTDHTKQQTHKQTETLLLYQLILILIPLLYERYLPIIIMPHYDRRIPRENREAIDIFITEQQLYNADYPSAWEDDRTIANQDGKNIDFRIIENIGRIFSLFPTAAYQHTLYYNDYYYLIERKCDRRVEAVLYQRQVDLWKRRNFDEWVGRSITANLDWYREHPDLPRHEFIPFIPFFDEYNFTHGACDEYATYTIYNRIRGGVVARWSYTELQSVWRRDFDAYLLPQRERGRAWAFT